MAIQERRMDRMTRMPEPTVERMHQQVADTKAALILVFAGAMLRFNDHDLAALLAVGGSALSGAGGK